MSFLFTYGGQDVNIRGEDFSFFSKINKFFFYALFSKILSLCLSSPLLFYSKHFLNITVNKLSTYSVVYIVKSDRKFTLDAMKHCKRPLFIF